VLADDWNPASLLSKDAMTHTLIAAVGLHDAGDETDQLRRRFASA
jgi:hypothetical protein